VDQAALADPRVRRHERKRHDAQIWVARPFHARVATVRKRLALNVNLYDPKKP
jgi:hypothetical protein